MARLSACSAASILLSLVLVVYAITHGLDLCFVVLEAVSVGALLLPYLGHLDYDYSVNVQRMSLVAPAVMIAIVCLGFVDLEFMESTFWNTTVFTYLLESFQVVQAFVTGFLIMVVVSNTCGFRLTKRWMILAAMFFALAYGVMCMFGYFLGMYFAGDEVFNKVGGYVAQEYNALMMSTCFTSTFVSAVVAFITTRGTRGMEPRDFITRGDVDE